MDVDTRETNRIIASDKVEGTAVYNPEGDRLGTVERFMVDKKSGQAEYAVMSFGGLFGIGDRHYPLPWQALTYDIDKNGYVVNVTKEQLEGAPNYERGGDEPNYDRDYGERVYTYYGYTYL
ncbi:PRC-barrel domain-containing protein [Sphingosinithalassobacter sp. CS137]|uniref:PRC-barrel domain-containing protein n=1 Tax=Sphingosinithalassobacter sp. CS137 TaxID=2762748 RepID=UPI00165E5071|nr:PRC-barrel domain-containing protein [Sphingosinithalassobacter sp. CS137]